MVVLEKIGNELGLKSTCMKKYWMELEKDEEKCGGACFASSPLWKLKGKRETRFALVRCNY